MPARERFPELRESRTTVRIAVLAGVATFLTMATGRGRSSGSRYTPRSSRTPAPSRWWTSSARVRRSCSRSRTAPTGSTNGALAVVSNLGREADAGPVTADLEPLRLRAGSVRATRLDSEDPGEQCTVVADGAVALPVPPRGFRIPRLEPAP